MANYIFVDSDQLDADLTAVADKIRAKGGTSEQLDFPSGFEAAIDAISTGVELNFDVVAYATEEALLAATPKENTIGFITTTAITSWIFSATAPAESAEGMVWISTGTSSTVEFNALKKNAIQVYPISVKQYVDGTWVSVTAYSRQGGEWKSWITYLYKAGDECTDVTGGWQGRAWKSTSADGHMADPFVLTKYGAYMHCSLGQNRTGVVEIVKDISFKGKKKLNLQCSNAVNNNTSIGLRLAIINRDASYWYTNALSIVSIVDGINYIELENYQNDNSYDVVIGAVTNEGSAEAAFDMQNVWLE